MTRIAGTESIDTAAETLQELIENFYLRDTREDAERWGVTTVPDFRGGHHGLRIEKFVFIVDVLCGCGACSAAKAREIVDHVLIIERAMIRGAGGSGDCEEVKRYFLEDLLVPQVFPRIPAHLRETEEWSRLLSQDPGALNQLRVRHTFGVVAP